MYFYAGYLCAPVIFRLAEKARIHTVAALVTWAGVNGLAVTLGYAALPGVSLALGFAGASAVVAFSALLAETRRASFLRAPGSQSLTIYLAFVRPWPPRAWLFSKRASFWTAAPSRFFSRPSAFLFQHL